MFELLRHYPGPRGQRPALFVSLILVLSLGLGQAAAGLNAPGDAGATHADALRAQVSAAGWLAVRVDLRASAAGAGKRRGAGGPGADGAGSAVHLTRRVL